MRAVCSTRDASRALLNVKGHITTVAKPIAAHQSLRPTVSSRHHVCIVRTYCAVRRECQRCGSGEVDDEAHMVFRSAALSVPRREYAGLFSPWPVNMRDFMSREPKALAAFAYACYELDMELKTS